MQKDVIFSGFGGQGILLIGKILADVGMSEGRYVTWFPSYGPEMRGGTAYCQVIISDDPIASPVVSNPAVAVVMNRPSMEKFGPKVKEGGLLLINSSLVPDETDRTDIEVVRVPANQLALEAGNTRASNMVILGALARCFDLVSKDGIKVKIEEEFRSKSQFISSNLAAFEAGFSHEG